LPIDEVITVTYMCTQPFPGKLVSESWRKGSSAASVRSPVVVKER